MRQHVALLRLALSAYSTHARLLAFFSIPFLLVFPLSFLLPNFVALAGTFLRFGSIGRDVTLADGAFILIAFLVSLALFSFSLVAINMVIRAQRTLSKVGAYEMERIERKTLRLFLVYLSVFVLSLLLNLALYDATSGGVRLQPILGPLITLVLSLFVLYVPQAIVIDEARSWTAVTYSMNHMHRKPGSALFFLVIAGLLLLITTGIFLALGSVIGSGNARIASLVVNGLILVPFLEVFKTQVYLSKYNLL